MNDRVTEFIEGRLTATTLLDWLEPWFPLLGSLVDTQQDAEWHAEGNVRIHTCMVLEALRKELEKSSERFTPSEKTALVIGAALHDIGKTLTTKEKRIGDKDRIVSPFHAETGMSYCAPRLAAFGELSDSEFQWILGVVGYHHHPRKLLSRSGTQARFWRVARSIPLRLLWIFERADIKGRICDDEEVQLENLELFKQEAQNRGVWNSAPYGDWKERVSGEMGVSDSAEADYAFEGSRFLFENDQILSLEEGIGKTYEARSDHGTLILPCGPSGSGKSTWVRQFVADHAAEVVSLDNLRREISGKRETQSDNGRVMQAAKELLREALRKKKTVIWDATNLRSDGRNSLIGLAHRYSAATEIVRFAIPPEELHRRNRKRTDQIPTAVLEKQLERYQWPNLWEAHRVETECEAPSKK